MVMPARVMILKSPLEHDGILLVLVVVLGSLALEMGGEDRLANQAGEALAEDTSSDLGEYVLKTSVGEYP